MVKPKTEEEIELLRENAILVSKTLAEVGKVVAPGVTTARLNEVAETFIRDNGAIPSFLGFEGFPAAICTSVNDVVVHGFPSDYVLKEGDIVTADIGTLYKGYNGDSAYTFPVGEVDAETRKLMDVTKASLYKASRRRLPATGQVTSDTRCNRTLSHSASRWSVNLKDTVSGRRCTRRRAFRTTGVRGTGADLWMEWSSASNQ